MIVYHYQLNQIVIITIAAAGLHVVYTLGQVNGIWSVQLCVGKCVIFNTHQERELEAACVHADVQPWLWLCLYGQYC